MADQARRHARQLREALGVPGIAWEPNRARDGETEAIMWAHALLGAAEAHLIGAEMEAMGRGLDAEALRAAYGPVRDEVVAAAPHRSAGHTARRPDPRRRPRRAEP
ncbi:hypothetical protein ACIBF1_19025 [Spirillospora sp. NPDC050679]